jgi:uncharacterized SAM-binding protein YcdF (DUF218 family)
MSPIARILDPLLLGLVMLGLGLFFGFRGSVMEHRVARLGRIAAWAAWGALWVLSTPFVSNALTVWLEIHGPNLDEALAGKDREKVALVVLAAGVRTYDPAVPLAERLDPAATQRTLTAARLWREQKLGLVVFSGTPPIETAAMTELAKLLGVPVNRVVRETQSRNTRENAAFTAAILREHHIDTVVLVTSATHLRRAIRDFDRDGVSVIPAASDLVGWPARIGIEGFLPASTAIARTHLCLHEILGYFRG